MLSLLRRLGRDVRIGTRLATAIAPPLVAVAALGSLVVTIERQNAAAMAAFNRLTHIAIDVGAVVHELQKERGMSAVFIGSGGKQMAAELPAQRRDTDTRLAVLRSRTGTAELPNVRAA